MSSTYILAPDRVCGPCEPALERRPSCPRSGHRPAGRHSELPLSKDDGGTLVSGCQSSAPAAAVLQSFCDQLGSGGRVVFRDRFQVASSCPAPRCTRSLAHKAKTGAADELMSSFNSQPLARKNDGVAMTRKGGVRLLRDEQCPKGGWSMWQRQILHRDP